MDYLAELKNRFCIIKNIKRIYLVSARSASVLRLKPTVSQLVNTKRSK